MKGALKKLQENSLGALLPEFYTYTVALQYTKASRFSFIVASYIIMLHAALYWQLILGGIIVIFSFFLLSKITTSAEET